MLPDLSQDIRWAVPTTPTSAFFAAGIKERKEFMVKDLAASGLEPGQVRAHVTDLMRLSEGAKGGYILPYFDLNGDIMRVDTTFKMYRIRQYGGKGRYTQPTSAELEAHGVPPNPPYILPPVHDYLADQKVLYICEGEKKAACVGNVLEVGAIGIGGCWNWGIKKRLHPWIKELITRYSVEKVVVIPDGDIGRYDICTAYGTLADELRRLNVPVEIVVLPEPEDKIDDLLVAWGPEAQGAFHELGKLESSQLVVSQSALAERYGLSTAGKDAKVVINDTNVHKLLSQHPSFSRFWLNTDSNDYMHGDDVVRWDFTDYELTCYMQHYFQLHNLNRPRVAEGIRAIAEQNKRSPFQEWVDALPWDGKSRLEDWAIRLWGCEDTPAVREVSKKFMVGMYARMADPGCKMDWMLVTVGAQGIGKSWFADLVTQGQSITFMASGNARDDAAKMHKGLIIVIDELDAFNKREMTYWKTMISTPVDTYRVPYGRGEVVMPRRSVLYGTSNHSTFLRHDDTGQRRFGVLQPTRMLDVELFREELQQLWAEAKECYLAGDSRYYELSAEVRAEVEEHHQGDDPLREQVEDFIGSWQSDKFRMTDLLNYLNMPDAVRNRAVTGQLKDILTSMDCEYKQNIRFPGRASPCRGYIIDREARPHNDKFEDKY